MRCGLSFYFVSHAAIIISSVQAVQLREQTESRRLSPLQEEFPWPVFYLHVPKTGGNFATTVAHTACNRCMGEENRLLFGGTLAKTGIPSCCSTAFGRFDGRHLPLVGDDFAALPEPKYNHVITMLREPRQRLISGFFHKRHDCNYQLQQDAPGCHGNDLNIKSCLPLHNAATSEGLERYAKCVSNCSVRMMAFAEPRGWCGEMSHSTEGPNTTEAEQAINHMTRDYAFVGLTDHYELSVCLWHKRFGTPCLPVEFENMRPGIRREDGIYDETAITPRVDRALTQETMAYEAAKARFFNELKLFGVSRSTCQKLCPEPAIMWKVDVEVANLINNHDAFEYDWPGRRAFDLDS